VENDLSSLQAIQKLNSHSGVKDIQIDNTDKKVIVPKGVDPNKEETLKKINDIKHKEILNNKVSVNEFANLFSYYLTNVLERKTSERMARYDQMDFIIENDGAIALSKKVLKDEILQSDVFNNPITVVAKNVAFKKAIEKLFKKLGVKDIIPECGDNLIRYGDAFWLLDVNGRNGIEKVIPTEPRDVRHRFEFSIAELKMQKNRLIKKFNGLQAIIELGSKMNSTVSQFNKVLLGFQVLNSIFPYWQVLHFRQFTTKKNLYPFGKPTFYDSQSEARMYLNSKVVVSMIRSSAFMREYVKVKTGEAMDPIDQWDTVQQAKQMMELFIDKSGKTNRDVPSFGERYFIPGGLLDIEQVTGGVNFRDRFEDLQLLREDVFVSTGMPKDYFTGGNSTYVPVKALMQQDKKTARMVFDLQNIVINQLIKLVEVHFTFTGEFDPYKEDFAISLPFPIPDIDDVMVSMASSKASYANSLINDLKTTLEITRIPETIIRKLLLKNFPFDDDDVDKIIARMRVDREGRDKVGIDPYGVQVSDPYLGMKKQADAMDMQMAQQQSMPQQGEPVQGEPVQGEPPQNAGVEDITKQAEKNPNMLGNQPKPQENIPQGMPVESFVEEYANAVKDKDIFEVFEKVICNDLMKEESQEFIKMGKHYITNGYVSSDRNVTGTVSFQALDAKKALLESKSYENIGKKELFGISSLHDSIVDKRYLSKEEKKVL